MSRSKGGNFSANQCNLKKSPSCAHNNAFTITNNSIYPIGKVTSRYHSENIKKHLRAVILQLFLRPGLIIADSHQ